MLRSVISVLLVICFYSANSQIAAVLRTEKQILDAFCKNDTAVLKKLVDDQFMLVHADGLVQNKADFVNAYTGLTPQNKLSFTSKY